MPLFSVSGKKATPVLQSDFGTERSLQELVEQNLETIFNCRFVASEFATGAVHGGRIDTLALSEDDNPVIIEYKKVVSSELVNQSLFYLAWLADHRGDFEVAARKTLGAKVEIDWSAIRVICIAPSYRKYDVYAVQVMGRAIELWTYRRFANGTLYLEQLQQSETTPAGEPSDGKNPVMVAAGKKAALTKKTATWTVDERLVGKSPLIVGLFRRIQEYILSLDPAIEEAPKKLYVAYRTTQNIVCVEVHQKKIYLYIKLDPKKHPGPKGISRDVTEIGHFGTGDLEVTIKSPEDLEAAKPYLERAYRQIGG
jgi:predicted transport protein